MDKHQNSAILLWGVFTILIATLAALQGHHHTVTPNYIAGALRWLHGMDLYNNTGKGFIYLPQSAILYIPFALMKFSLSEVIVRIIALGLLAFALYRSSFLITDYSPAKTFLIVTLVVIPISFSSARNGQFNIIITALMLISLCDIVNEKWSRVTFYLVLGLALKPTMIVFLLLITVLYRPLWWRVPVALIAMIMVPFLTQRPSYVIQQYANAITMLNQTAQVGIVSLKWAQLFGLLKQFGLIVPQIIQLSSRMIAALLTLLLAFKVKYKFNAKKVVIVIFILAACYLMLFNPRTENNDYVILAPAIGYFIAMALAAKRFWRVAGLIVLSVIIILGYYIASLITPGANYWVTPLMALLFTILVIRDIFTAAA